mgnify:CR=1 FL=1
MKVIFCKPELTMRDTSEAEVFFDECKQVLDNYIPGVYYVGSALFSQMVSIETDKDDIFIFFTAEDGNYSNNMLNTLKRYNANQSRIWAIAMNANPECRRPPEPIADKQSFDVSSRKENRLLWKNNIKAIAQIFSRKIIGQTLSPLYRDEVLYFISHKRADGEPLAAKLADKLKLLTRENNVYRDVVNVKVGEDAQKDIDENLKVSDALIFLQTELACESEYIMKELCYAQINDIPILWIQIDDAPYDKLPIRPGDKPLLKYNTDDFMNEERLIEITDEIEEMCFKLIMESSGQVYTYVDYLMNLKDENKISLVSNQNRHLAYEIEYKEETKDLYDDGIRKHYIQCFGRNPKEQDVKDFINDVKEQGVYDTKDKLFLLSGHGKREQLTGVKKIFEENYDDYIVNLHNVAGEEPTKRNKRIIVSGAFPDYDGIYKNSLMEAILIYSKQIIRKGYTLVFGAHPSFQEVIFNIGKIYSPDVKYSIEMHMDQAYIGNYDLAELNKKCTLVLSDGLQEMRESMICKQKAEMMICLGGKIKVDKSQQGVDVEVALARGQDIPVALVGTVGGRSSEFAFEILQSNLWGTMNPWSKELNESLFYNVNHRLMSERLLREIEKKG